MKATKKNLYPKLDTVNLTEDEKKGNFCNIKTRDKEKIDISTKNSASFCEML